MKHILVIVALTALTTVVQAQDKKPTPYATSAQQQMQEQQAKSAELSAKLMADKKKRAACRAEAKAQKISMLKRRAYVSACVKR